MNAAAQTAHNPASSSAELYRLLCNLLRVGTVQLVDHANAKIRVQTGGLTTHWVRWLEHRAGHTVTWSPPTVGEQVLLLSPGGDLSAAIALRGLYSDAAPAPTAAPAKTMCAFPDGATSPTTTPPTPCNLPSAAAPTPSAPAASAYRAAA